MEATQLQGLDIRDRIAVLEDTADKVEVTKYLVQLTPEELDIKREQLAEASIEQADLAQEAKDVAAQYKERLKPINQTIMDRILEIKTKQEMREGKVFHLANFESRMMETYDERGELIGTRRLRPEEQQATLFVQKQ